MLRHGLATALVMLGAAALAPSTADAQPPTGDIYKLELRQRLHLQNLFDSVGTDVGDDAGDYSFVRQAVPILLGRKVRGYDELTMFVSLVRASDRAAFVRMITDRRAPTHAEYLEHWSNFFVDRMRVHRETERSLTACFTPRRTLPPDGELASCIASNPPATSCRGSGTGAADFSMGDVLRSAIALDNLEPAFRAYLFPMVSTPGNGADATVLNRRDSVAETFAHVYLHRNLGCLTCHNTSASVSGEFDIHGNRSYWNRHHPVPGAFEIALYEFDSGRDRNQVHAPFRAGSDFAGGERPWQMSNCGSFMSRASVPDDTQINLQGTPFEAFFTKNLGRRSSVWEIEETLRAGTTQLRMTGLRRDRLRAGPATSCTDHCAGIGSPPAIPEPPAAVKTLFDDCSGCHQPGHSSQLDLTDNSATAVTEWLARVVSEPVKTGHCAGFSYLVVPGQPTQSCLNRLIELNQMPPGGGLTTEKTAVLNWIAGLPAGSGCDVGEPSVCAVADNDNHAAFAYLTAMNIVNQVWEEAMGNSLTIANYFPRNPFSRDVLQNLTETVFVPGGWSLRELLAKILASEQFNRRAPDTTVLASAYVQRPVAKPFDVNDPRMPPEALPGWIAGGAAPSPDFGHVFFHMRDEGGRSRHRNSIGDAVYRYGAHTLFRSTTRALGWPSGNHITGGASYPSDSLRKAMGQYFQDAEPGFRGLGFQSLLRWEQDQGLCGNRSQPSVDWIGQVIVALQTPPAGTTYRNGDVAVLVRDWLLADGTLGTTTPGGQSADERALLSALYGDLAQQVDVSTPAARSALEAKMRAHCGASLLSPQFLLAGIAPESLGPRPALRVCLPGEPCTFREVCVAMEAAARGTIGEGIIGRGRVISRVVYTCTDTTLTIDVLTQELPEDWQCPRHFCTAIPGGPQLRECIKDLQSCMPRQPPGCRPGCALIDCCGGPLPPIDGPRYKLVWLENAVVERAAGVNVYRSSDRGSKRRVIALEKGMRLQAGDWLEIRPGAELRISAAGTVLQTPKGGAPRTKRDTPDYLQVTGPEVLSAREPFRLAVPVPPASIKRALEGAKPPSHEVRMRVREQPGRTPPREDRPDVMK